MRERALDLDVLAQTRVGVRALQRPHRPARQPRRGRAARRCPAPTSTAFYELRPLPYAEAGYGYPESGQTRHQRDQRQAHPPARRRRAVRRPLRRAPPPRARRSTCAPGMLRRAASSGRSPAGARCACAPSGSSRSSQRAVAAIHYEVEPLDGRCAVVVQSELVANEPLPARADGRPARRGARCESPLESRGPRADTSSRAVLVHRTRASGLRMAAGDGPRGRRPGRHRAAVARARPDLGRVTVAARARARASRCGS